MKPYPHYKPTGLPWLPSIPEHWEIKRLKNLFAERKEANRDGNNTKVLSLLKDVGVVPYEEKGNVGNKSKEDITQYKIARKGDLVLNSMNVIIGSVGVSEYDGCVSPVYYALRPRDGTNAKYYEHLFRLPNVQKTIRGRANGILEIRLRISAGALLDLPFPIPPPSEQARIVRYLDDKTAAIADLICAKEREIELLRELIVLHAEESMQAATGKRFRLKRFVRQITEEITVEPSRTYHPLGVLNRGRGLFHKDSVLGADLGDSTFFHVYPGDMIISGQFAWEGAVAMLEESERGCIASHRYPLVRSASDKLRLEYLWAFFQTHYGDMILNLHSHGAAGRNRPLNFGELIDEYVPIPSIDKQDKIAGLVRKLSLLRRNATTFKTRMMELRTRLVSDAVTGAVEV